MKTSSDMASYIRCGLFVTVFLTAVSGENVTLRNSLRQSDSQQTRSAPSDGSGVRIKSAYDGSCLNPGCCNFRFSQIFLDKDCPSWEWLKWTFQGPMLVVQKPLFAMCLDCRDGSPNCLIGTSRCNGYQSQKWSLGLRPNITNNSDLLFSIHNHLHPQQCVTVDADGENGIMLRDCIDPPVDEQLFHVDVLTLPYSTGPSLYESKSVP